MASSLSVLTLNDLGQGEAIPTPEAILVSREDFALTVQRVRCKFRRACQQVDLLDIQEEDIEVRLQRANKAGQTNLCFMLALRIQTVESVRAMMYQYAAHMADLLDYLLEQIYEDSVFTEGSMEALLDQLEQNSED